MKVLMWGRSDLYDIGGGDKIQIENTAIKLRELGVQVDISTSLKTDPRDYDLVHLFQLDWTPETYLLAKRAKKFNKPLVLSPIHHSVKEVKRFENEYAFGFRKVTKNLFRKQHARDTVKNIYRSIYNPQKRIPTLISLLMGLKNQHTKTLSFSDKVIVQTSLEAKDLINTYNVDIDWVKIQNGVGEQFLEKKNHPNPIGLKDYLLCVGRIEARKNQLSIIEAVKRLRQEESTNLTLVFVGKKSENHGEYVEKFDKKVGENNWIIYKDHTPYEDMPGLYQHAKVCVSASWFETCGLTSLEALFMGTNAVASGIRMKEIFGDKVSYCDPGDIESIKRSINGEYLKDRPLISDKLKEEFTWQRVAEDTLKIYKKVCKNKDGSKIVGTKIKGKKQDKQDEMVESKSEKEKKEKKEERRKKRGSGVGDEGGGGLKND